MNISETIIELVNIFKEGDYKKINGDDIARLSYLYQMMHTNVLDFRASVKKIMEKDNSASFKEVETVIPILYNNEI